MGLWKLDCCLEKIIYHNVLIIWLHYIIQKMIDYGDCGSLKKGGVCGLISVVWRKQPVQTYAIIVHPLPSRPCLFSRVWSDPWCSKVQCTCGGSFRCLCQIVKGQTVGERGFWLVRGESWCLNFLACCTTYGRRSSMFVVEQRRNRGIHICFDD